MALKIRLSRGGSKKRPFYRIVVAEAAAPRDGRYVERVGHYNPMVPKEHENRLSVNSDRVKFWMNKGAQPTDRVHKLLALADILKAPEIREQPKKSAVGKKRAEREAEVAEAKAAADAAAEEAHWRINPAAQAVTTAATTAATKAKALAEAAPPPPQERRTSGASSSGGQPSVESTRGSIRESVAMGALRRTAFKFDAGSPVGLSVMANANVRANALPCCPPPR